MLYDPHTVSEITGIPLSTLRRLAAENAELLSESARKTGKKRRYTEDDILVLRRLRTGQNPKLVKTKELAALPVEIVEQFDNFSAQLAELRSEVEKQRQEIQAASERLAEFERRAQLPWWKRLGGK